jgi:hypothetical protein
MQRIKTVTNLGRLAVAGGRADIDRLLSFILLSTILNRCRSALSGYVTPVAYALPLLEDPDKVLAKTWETMYGCR